VSLFVQKRTTAWAILGLLLFAVVVVVIQAVLQAATTTTQIRGTQKTNVPKIDNTAETLKTVKRLAEKIDSCTDPTGECAKRGQRQTAAAVGNIRSDTRNVVVATIVCQQQGARGFEAIAACVDRAVAAVAHPKP
jgi:hypothetical protein